MSDEKGVRYREFPEQRTTVEHYPMAPGDVVVRWRDHPTDPDARGYIVEAHVGEIVEGAGHYGADLSDARKIAHRIVRYLRAARTTLDTGGADDQ